MQVYSLVTRKLDHEEVIWSGLYFVQAVDDYNYVVGKCVCLYTDDELSYSLYEPYSVGWLIGFCIDFFHLQKKGTLLLDDGEELNYTPSVSKVKK